MEALKKIKLLILCLALMLALTSVTLAKVEFSEDLFIDLAQNINDIPYIEIPDYERLVLENGITVYLVQDNQLPIVEMHGFIMGGRSQESPELPGISDLMVQMMNTGTANMGEHEFSLYKGLNGLDFNILTAYDNFVFTGNALSMDQNQLIGLAADVLQNPDFTADYFMRNVQEYYQLLAYALYRDDMLLDMFFNTTLFGVHPYSNGSNVLSVLQVLPSITPEHLQDYYNRTIDPANMILLLVGDIDKTEMFTLLQNKFGNWESQGIKLQQPEIVVNESNYNKIILVHKTDATHAKMKMGYNFYDINFADRNAFTMVNRVFGSGAFSSRLMDVLRTQKGYVYGVQSAAQYYQLGGLFYITTDVAPEKVLETRELIKEQMELIKNGSALITEQELFNNVNLYNAFFPQSYKHKINIMSDLVYKIEALGESENAINEFVAEYNGLSAAEAQRVFSEHIFPDRFLTVIVGNKDQILPAFLEQEIEVEVIELF